MSKDLYPKHVKSMMTEYEDLMIRVRTMKTLMDSDVFNGLVFRKKNLIRRQYESMRQYAEILHERIDIERAQIAA